MANKKNFGELNRTDKTDKAIYDLANEFFAQFKPTEKALKMFLSREQQRSVFLKWIDNLVEEWAEDNHNIAESNSK